MKQYTILFGVLMAFGFVMNVQAETLKSGSILCVDQKHLAKYQAHLAKNETAFLVDMRDRAQCVENNKPYDVSVLETSGDFSRVEVLHGPRIWVQTADLIMAAVE